jgi:phage terminase large subunit GpA-like protein
MENARHHLRQHHKIEDESTILRYHVFCNQCGKEFFFTTNEMPDEEDKAFYLCPDCKKFITKKLNNIN